MATTWHYIKNGNQIGPVSQGEIVTKIRAGELTDDDYVWKDGMPQWATLGTVLKDERLRRNPPPAATQPIPPPVQRPTRPRPVNPTRPRRNRLQKLWKISTRVCTVVGFLTILYLIFAGLGSVGIVDTDLKPRLSMPVFTSDVQSKRENLIRVAKQMEGPFWQCVESGITEVENGGWSWQMCDDYIRFDTEVTPETWRAYQEWRTAKIAEDSKKN